jgi:hypothetical protein
MNKSEYLQRALEAYDTGRVDADTYDAMVENADIFCDEDEDDRLPSWYAEVEYDNFDNPEAVEGAKFDDINLRRYMER